MVESRSWPIQTWSTKLLNTGRVLVQYKNSNGSPPQLSSPLAKCSLQDMEFLMSWLQTTGHNLAHQNSRNSLRCGNLNTRLQVRTIPSQTERHRTPLKSVKESPSRQVRTIPSQTERHRMPLKSVEESPSRQQRSTASFLGLEKHAHRGSRNLACPASYG